MFFVLIIIINLFGTYFYIVLAGTFYSPNYDGCGSKFNKAFLEGAENNDNYFCSNLEILINKTDYHSTWGGGKYCRTPNNIIIEKHNKEKNCFKAFSMFEQN